MKNKVKITILTLTIFILLTGITAITAADINDTNTQINSQAPALTPPITQIVQNNTMKENTVSKTKIENTKNIKATNQKKNTENSNLNTNPTITSNNINTINNNKTNSIDKKTDIISVNSSKTTTLKTIKTKNTYNITSSNYNTYFKFDKTNGIIRTTDIISNGDTLDLSGKFTNLNFTVDKNLTFTSSDSSARLYNCTVMVWGLNSSGSTVSNLNISNNNQYGSGIYLNGTTHNLITNNRIHVWGPYAFSIPVDNTNYTTICNNNIENSVREDTYRVHTAMPLGTSYYNNIVNNTVKSFMANGIYLSYYGSGLFQGGLCYYNNITRNRIYGGDTSWCYTIQAMGGYNNITYNTVSGGYRGISTQSDVGNYIAHNNVTATAEGIFACEGSTVEDNLINVHGTVTGITTGGNGVIISRNVINTEYGMGINIGSSNLYITSNNITTINGYGIYGKGAYTNINIISNNITSGNTGILLKKQSSSKKCNNILINQNIVNSNSDYAIDLYEAGAKNPENINITVTNSNIVSSLKGNTLDNAYRGPSNSTSQNITDSNKTYVVTKNNYNVYFDAFGNVNNDKILSGDTIILKGTFENKNFIFNTKVKLIGQNSTIVNGTITLTSDISNALITNITIRNSNQTGIKTNEVYNCTISNNDIKVNQEWTSYGIYVRGSYNTTIINNKIRTTGNNINYALFLYGSDRNTIKNNTIRAVASKIPNPYNDEVPVDSDITIKEILQNYGILLIYSSSNIIEANDVKMTSEFKSYISVTENCKNSVVGIDIYYDSNNNKVINNKVVVDTKAPYSYGIGVLGAPWGSNVEVLNATNNQFLNNTVYVSGGYFATGFIVGLNSINTTVDNNRFTVLAKHNKTSMGDYTYGITLESSQRSIITNNRIVISSNAVYSMEIFDSNNNIISGNIIKGTGSYVYGIVGYKSSNNNVTYNVISLNKKYLGVVSPAKHSDAIPYGDAGINFNTYSYSNNVSYNSIDGVNQDYAIVLTDQTGNNIITENSLKSKGLIADQSVFNGQKSNKVNYNYVYRVKISVKTATGYITKNMTLITKVGTNSNDTSNLTATFKIGSTVVGTSKIVNGTAKVTFSIPSTWRASTYNLKVSIKGTNFQNVTSDAKIVIKNIDKTITKKLTTNNTPLVKSMET